MTRTVETDPIPISHTPYKDRALSETILPRDQALKRMRKMYGFDPSSFSTQNLSTIMGLNIETDLNTQYQQPSCVYYAKYAYIAAQRMGLQAEMISVSYVDEEGNPDLSGHTYVFIEGEDRTKLLYNLKSVSDQTSLASLNDSSHFVNNTTQEHLEADDTTL